MNPKQITYSAPGKVILFGEHAVVYGYPAIVSAIDLRIRCIVKDSNQEKIMLVIKEKCIDKQIKEDNDVTFFLDFENGSFVLEKGKQHPDLDPTFSFIVNEIFKKTKLDYYPLIKYESEIPIAAGLGSSAARSVATIASLFEYIGEQVSQREICDLAFKAEKIVHGNPSGVDNTISTYGGIHFYENKEFIPIGLQEFPGHIVIANSMIHRNTKEYVEKVGSLIKKEPEKYKDVLEKIGKITIEAKTSLIDTDIDRVGELMNLNHAFLEELGVGHPLLSKLVKILNQNGSLGSKLTGAGGGGCVIGVFDNLRKAIQATENIQDKGFQAFITKISNKGVQRE